MPRRTNKFQQLVRLLQEQLAETAEVEESAMLTDRRTGRKVEVDVVVRTKVQGIEVTFGFECTDRKRPVDVNLVQQKVRAHESIAIDKTILVSASGFTEGAIKEAEASDALPISLEAAEDADWRTWIAGLGDLRLAGWAFKALGGSVWLQGDQAALPLTEAARFIRADGAVTTLLEYVRGVMARPDLAQRVFRRWLELPPDDRPSTFEFTVTSTPTDSLELLAPQGERRQVTKIDTRVGVTVDTTPLTLETAQLHGHQIAFGTAANIFRDKKRSADYVLINLVRTGSGVSKASLLFPPAGAGDTEVHHMRTAQEGEDDEGSA